MHECASIAVTNLRAANTHAHFIDDFEVINAIAIRLLRFAFAQTPVGSHRGRLLCTTLLWPFTRGDREYFTTDVDFAITSDSTLFCRLNATKL